MGPETGKVWGSSLRNNKKKSYKSGYLFRKKKKIKINKNLKNLKNTTTIQSAEK
jgi:hypothetical protein